MMNGIINVYKEKGFTSFDVVAKLRGILQQKKIGHTGTLDPAATGVLPVCLGKATRVCDLLTEKDKVYEAVMLMGITTDTQDISGRVLTEQVVTVTEEELRKQILSFVGEYAQIPPMYSALKVQGRKLCDLAREGIEIERKPRNVLVYSIEIIEMALPRVRLKVHCSKGTYIRTLCHDIGAMAGCGACMESLVRIRVADFKLEEAFTLSEIEEAVKRGDIETLVAPVDIVFQNLMSLQIKEEFEKFLMNGNRLEKDSFLCYSKECENGKIRIYDANGKFAGIYQFDKERNQMKPVKLFME